MTKNNHFSDSNQTRLDGLLRHQATGDNTDGYIRAINYAESIVAVENCIAVVSNLADNTSKIIAGKFAETLNLDGYSGENSIWEKRILSLMTEEEQQEKFIAELRFFHYLRKMPPSRREQYYLVSRLRFRTGDNNFIDVMHRMYYVYNELSTSVIAAVCLYGPLTFGFSGKSFAVNAVNGLYEELTHSSDRAVLSKRECQVLSLIDSGLKSKEIADKLNISIHTVNRHRQSILESLKVKNSHEACSIAKSMNII